MNGNKRVALILKLAEQLKANESWCGETHIQKAAYFYQRLLGAPLGFDFTLYKHGPYAFDLSDELSKYQIDGFLSLKSLHPKYRPGLVVTNVGKEFVGRFPKTIGIHQREIDFIAQKLGPKNVKELERLATALYVIKEQKLTADQAVAERISDLKPHVSKEDALKAVKAVMEMEKEATTSGLVS